MTGGAPAGRGTPTPPPFAALVPLFNATGWAGRASCAGLDPDEWHPDASLEGSGRHTMSLRQVCWSCPVRLECLAAAVSVEGTDARGTRYGVFGGLTGAERAKEYRAAYEAWMRPPRCVRAEVGTLKGHLIHLKQGEISCHACCGAAKAERESQV